MPSQIARPLEPNFKPFKMPKQKKRYALPKQSEKRVAEDREYYAKRREYLNENPTCEFEGCNRIASDIHHRAGRGASYLDESTFFASCRIHHRWIHGNPAEAREMGLLA